MNIFYVTLIAPGEFLERWSSFVWNWPLITRLNGTGGGNVTEISHYFFPLELLFQFLCTTYFYILYLQTIFYIYKLLGKHLKKKIFIENPILSLRNNVYIFDEFVKENSSIIRIEREISQLVRRQKKKRSLSTLINSAPKATERTVPLARGQEQVGQARKSRFLGFVSTFLRNMGSRVGHPVRPLDD